MLQWNNILWNDNKRGDDLDIIIFFLLQLTVRWHIISLIATLVSFCVCHLYGEHHYLSKSPDLFSGDVHVYDVLIDAPTKSKSQLSYRNLPSRVMLLRTPLHFSCFYCSAINVLLFTVKLFVPVCKMVVFWFSKKLLLLVILVFVNVFLII